MKLFKTLAAFFLIFGLFAVSGCTSQSFCSEKDKTNITEKVVEKLDDAFLNETTFKSNDGKVYGFEQWKTYYIELNKITDQAAKDAVTVENWKNATNEEKSAYVQTIYRFDNAACLTLEEREKTQEEFDENLVQLADAHTELKNQNQKSCKTFLKML